MNILNRKLVVGILIFIMLSLTTVSAGNVIVKEGSVTVEDNFNSSNLFFINKTIGKIGINTIIPQNLLNIVGDINGTGNITAGSFFVGDGRFLTNLPVGSEADPKWTANITNYFIKAQWNATNGSYLKDYGDTATGAYTFDSPTLVINVVGYEDKVGIGTTTPNNLLQVNSGAAPFFSQFKLTANDAGALTGFVYSADNVALSFDSEYTSGSWMARDTSAALISKGGSYADKLTFFGNTGLTSGVPFTPTARMTMNLSNGNVGIGTTTPADTLTIVGNVNASGCFEIANGTIIGGSCVSDLSTKIDVKNYSIDLTKLLALSPKEFEYKDTSIYAGTKTYNITEEVFDEKTNETKIVNKTISEDVYYNFPEGTQKGFISDEVGEIYPEFVETDEFGFKRVIYGMNWVFELWKQNQEQQNLLDQQASEIYILKSELCVKDNTYSWCEK